MPIIEAIVGPLGKLIDKTFGFRVSPEDESAGIDFALHAETAYEHGVLGHGPIGGQKPGPFPHLMEKATED